MATSGAYTHACTQQAVAIKRAHLASEVGYNFANELMRQTEDQHVCVLDHLMNITHCHQVGGQLHMVIFKSGFGQAEHV